MANQPSAQALANGLLQQGKDSGMAQGGFTVVSPTHSMMGQGMSNAVYAGPYLRYKEQMLSAGQNPLSQQEWLSELQRVQDSNGQYQSTAQPKTGGISY